MVTRLGGLPLGRICTELWFSEVDDQRGAAEALERLERLGHIRDADR